MRTNETERAMLPGGAEIANRLRRLEETSGLMLPVLPVLPVLRVLRGALGLDRQLSPTGG